MSWVVDLFRGASPFALVRRDLLRGLRQPTSGVMCALVVGGGSVLIYTVWSMMTEDTSLVESHFVTDGFLYGTVGAFGALIALLIPSMSGATISSEYDGDTYDLLRLSLISPASLVLGKILNCLGLVFFIFVMVMPLIGCIYFLLGINWFDLMVLFAIVMTGTLLVTSAGVFCSVWFRRYVPAILASYAAMLVLFGVVFGALASLVLVVFDGLGASQTAARLMEQVIYATAYYFPPGTYVMYAAVIIEIEDVVRALIVQLGVAALFVLGAIVRVGRPDQVAVGGEGTRKRERKTKKHRRRTYPALPDNRNPIVMRERYWGAASTWQRSSAMFILPTIVGILPIFMFLDSGLTARELFGMWFGITVSMAAIFVPPITAYAFAVEHTRNTMDPLRLSLLEGRDIVRGKTLAAFWALRPLLLSLMFTGGAMTIVVWGGLAVTRLADPEIDSWSQTDLGFPMLQAFSTSLSLALCVILLVTVSLMCSMLTRKVSSAVALAYLGSSSALFFVGMGLIAYLEWRHLGWVAGQYQTYRYLYDTAEFLSPVMAYYHVFDSFGNPDYTYYCENILYNSMLILGFHRLSIWLFERFRMVER